MSGNLDQDQINRLWEHMGREDGIFNDRLNFFIVFESILLGVVASLFDTISPKVAFVLHIIILLGFLLTLTWVYIQARQKYILSVSREMVKQVAPEYVLLLEQRERIKWPISVTWLLTYLVPALIALIWIILFFSL